MPDTANSLLPAGLYDLLPPNAAHERFVSGALVDAFERFGYDQVMPPLMEFEASLLAGRSGKALASQTFRVMDALSQEMMGFRPDITLQIGRIAAARMAERPRPLRVCYSGSTLRVKGEGKERARQWRQAGIELIGAHDPKADAEVIAVAAHAVTALGVNGLVVDITLPGLVKQVLDASGISEKDQEAIAQAVECKDAGRVRDAGLSGYAAALDALIRAAGPADKGMEQLAAISLPEEGRGQVEYVKTVIAQLKTLGVPVEITLDPVENRGFEYHSIISFTLFSRDTQSELGRGGRYAITHANGREEPATGMTLYVNTLMADVPVRSAEKRVLVAADASMQSCASLQGQGFATLRVLGSDANAEAARRLGCTHVLDGNTPRALA